MRGGTAGPRACARRYGRPTCLCAAADADDSDPLDVRPHVSLVEDDAAHGTRADCGTTAHYGPETAYGADPPPQEP
ncbi:hypothetical protein JCM4914_52590 [Streptomyces platensis subsp. malvinus]